MIGILGGGLAGLTVARHSKSPCEVLEGSDRVGGHLKSTVSGGYTFDEGPHIIFSKNKTTLNYMLSLLGDNVVDGERNNQIYYDGNLIKYPFENGIGGLNPQERFECVRDFQRRDKHILPNSFNSWLLCNFGKAITDKYLLPYNEKIWKCNANDMAWDWAEGRLPRPTEEEVLKSACGVETEGYTHQLNFYYPKVGGIESLVKAQREQVKSAVFCNRQIAAVLQKENRWVVSDWAGWREYDKIVSTIPLHDMVDIFVGVPPEVKQAARNLRFNSLLIVTLGITTNSWRCNELRWKQLTAVYVPDSAIRFHRVSFPPAFSSSLDCVQVEITTNLNDAVWNTPNDFLIGGVLSDLVKMDLVKSEQPGYKHEERLKYAYPVPTHDYRENLKLVRDYFESLGVVLCGRNAEFEYINMDQCIERGIKVGESL